MRMSKIFKKTLLLTMVLFGLVSTTASVLSAWTLYTHMTGEYVSKGKAIAQAIADSSVEVLLNRDSATIQSTIDQFLAIEGLAYVFVVDGSGHMISHTFVPEVPAEVLGLGGEGTDIEVADINVPGIGAVIDISQPILAGVAGRVHVGMERRIIRSYVFDAIVRMQIVLFFMFWGCVAVLYVAVNSFSRPLDRLTEYAHKLSAHDFDAEINIETHDEIGVLGETLKYMAGELSSHFDELEQTVDKATADLSDTLTYLRTIINNLADGLLVVDVTGRVALFNPALGSMFSLETDDLAGKQVEDMFPEALVDLTRAIRGSHREAYQAEVPLAGERTGTALATSITRGGDQAMCLGSVILIRDITREKELDLLKTDFISTISHELRTPMTSIMGFTKMIKKRLEKSVAPHLGEVGDEMRRALGQVGENVNIIVSESERLTELVNDVLDIAKLESGKVEWAWQSVRLPELVRHVANTLGVLAQSKGLELGVEIEPELPEITADRDRVIQVLVNLVSNAIKFTERGRVWISVEKNGQMLIVCVHDTGAGISTRDQGLIFEKFKQAGDTLTDKPHGTGLGLPICRQIVERHGGGIWVESQVGQGSRFCFTLPLTPPANLPEPPDLGPHDDVLMVRPMPDAAERDCSLVLVVEDDPNVNHYLLELFSDAGLQAVGAKDGFEALELARARMPGLITMDVMMPGMDGASTIDRLRADPFTRHIPVIVITAAASLSKSAGGDAALVKPVDEDRLLDLARAFLQEDRLSQNCLVLGEGQGDPTVHRLCNICPGDVVYCLPEEVWTHVDGGFTGTIFVPMLVRDRIALDRLSSMPGIQVVILPE